jgi:chemotaxis protein methyltransferase CheR
MRNNISNKFLKMVSEEIELKFGLYFSEHRFKDLKRCLINAANLKGIDLELYIELFLSKLLSIEDCKELANCLTIGETYFFRDKKLFDVLRNNVIPNIIYSKRDKKTITFWSSGCSTGEEAYSIAILMKELLMDFNQWNINIIATDINLNSLSKAREAIYGEWSFRETDLSFKNQYFDMIEPNQYKLKEEIKKSVTFTYLNLADEIYAIDNNIIQEVDIIFCRNVLMYFSEEQAKKIVERYYKILNIKGWLIVAPSESLFLNKTEFISTNINKTFLYGKAEEKKQNLIYFDSIIPNEIKCIEKDEIYKPIEKPSAKITQFKVNECKVDYEEQCRLKANEGDLEQALLLCKEAINQNKVNPIYYHLLASIEQELGNIKYAVDALKKAIYLDSNFIMAYFDLGNLFLKLGKNKEALKSFDNVKMLLQGFQEEQDIPNTESITAGMLKHFITNILKEKEIHG